MNTTWIKKLWKNKWIKGVLFLGAFGILFLIGLYFSIYLGAFGKLPSTQDLSSIIQEESTEVLDKDGLLIGKYYIYDRQPLEYKDFPEHLIDALVATEDVRFFQHDGIDNVSLLRVFVKSILLQDKSSGGGSTVTLQLAKNLFGRKDYWLFGIVVNKFKESIIAKRLEEIYTKEEILTLYFNTVPFSDNTYGIESASQKFFNKSTKDLTISESAILVGSLKANTYYNPRLNLKRSQERRDVVLSQMEKYGYLPKDSLEAISQEDVVLNYRSFNHDMGVAPYFREQVKKELTAILDTIVSPDGEPYDLYKDGLVVHTTLDYKMQELAEEAMKSHMTKLQKAFEDSYGDSGPWTQDKLIDAEIKKLPKYKQYKAQGLSDAQINDSLAIKRDVELFSWEGDTIRNISVRDSISEYLKLLNTGMLSVDPSTGAVRTYIGGIDYRVFKYDHITQSERQVGSTFKPVVYTAAIQNGMDPCAYFSLAKVTYTNYDNWTPGNSGGDEVDPYENYSLEKALSHSVNTIAVKVLNKVGIPKVVEQAKKMGITKELPAEPSLALGVAQINLKELTGAYTSFVNGNHPVKPYYITKIEDRNGNVIASFEPEIAKDEAFSDYTRQVMLEFMQATVNEGTAKRLRSSYGLNNAMAGKTGTTQDNKDGWFVGITPKLVTVTWVGNDNHSIGFKTTGMGQGANSALPIFAEFYQKLNADISFNDITNAKFESPSEQVISDLSCAPEKRDSFLKRLFKSKNKKKKFKGE
ncbi:transglycosylase domain-containing protein [Tamlana sp. 2_MG-2023]|uniref:transglycosylase domain-containing protein n=1 Tax=unclassified Tamlana TaxID=2614803 RepID=UPI0026E11C4D|nr:MULTISPECIES: transglycosylase domain-containing protein [unclassified Tamlana]MDO6760533.1 transglycosylase domain-containing protein [Tamlana sp. 2_MG-2023]MDO6790789.1 transglycosylase domain-containing protein [Tamlana sp. 1_MG-2023]